eukprot:CAMPEP_0117751590 /NCGR_PEP_ID=MMETSP0947-20121206/11070_1 /TAXON_ID=44440 /ORGANISM="Chattonella subsalsa, Strain CCMP2191" /LENGTH=408 /DNA_ID=CAMNT_0005570009 /DNA_START=85 /DNA_END=1311 /DNA_ORIENTATION=+
MAFYTLLSLISLLHLSAAFLGTPLSGCNRQSHRISMAVEKKDSYDVTLLTGDGIGPEITEATVAALAPLEDLGFKLNFKEALIGGAALDATGHPFPDESLEQCKNSDSVLLACIGGYKWDANPRHLRPETGLLRMRKEMGLYANLRPAKVMPQLLSASTLKPEVLEGVDIMVVRELTGDVYFGQPKGTEERDGKRVAYNNMIYDEEEISRIAKVAFDVAMKRGKKVCSIDKANVLDVSQLWRDVVIEEHANYPEVELSHMYIDNAAMQLIRWPKQFDTVVCGNLFGDIISDEASMLVGSLGMLPSASIGNPSGPGVFEPCHGSAPDIAGEDKANPLAMILSAAMMLRYDLSRPDEAQIVEDAVEKVLDVCRTGDIKDENLPVVGCKQMGEEVAKLVKELVQSKSLVTA